MTANVFGLTWEEIVAVIAAFSFMWYELKAIRRDIARLEAKQDKYNHLQERVIRLEGKVWRTDER